MLACYIPSGTICPPLHTIIFHCLPSPIIVSTTCRLMISPTTICHQIFVHHLPPATYPPVSSPPFPSPLPISPTQITPSSPPLPHLPPNSPLPPDLPFPHPNPQHPIFCNVTNGLYPLTPPSPPLSARYSRVQQVPASRGCRCCTSR